MTNKQRDLTAIESMLARDNSQLHEGRKSLRNLCKQAADSPMGYAPQDWVRSEQAVWCMGFCEAMNMVLAYIDGTPPSPITAQSERSTGGN